MLRSTPRGGDFKQEEGSKDGKNPKTPSGSRPWSMLKDPRIVRVTRSFGGKDRHSKVQTVRGLRDRRVRLSVPTAIQLYDLQDKLGLNQPSKVVDWLLRAAQQDIDKLPPLQMESFMKQSAHPMVASDNQASSSPIFSHPLALFREDKSGGSHHHHHVPVPSLWGGKRSDEENRQSPCASYYHWDPSLPEEAMAAPPQLPLPLLLCPSGSIFSPSDYDQKVHLHHQNSGVGPASSLYSMRTFHVNNGERAHRPENDHGSHATLL